MTLRSGFVPLMSAAVCLLSPGLAAAQWTGDTVNYFSATGHYYQDFTGPCGLAYTYSGVSTFARGRSLAGSPAYFGHIITPNSDIEFRTINNGALNYVGAVGSPISGYVWVEGPEAGQPVNLFGRTVAICGSDPLSCGDDRLKSIGPGCAIANSEVVSCLEDCCTSNANFFTVWS